MISKQASTFYLLFITLLVTFSGHSYANELESLRVWLSQDKTRVVLDLKSEADYSYFTLSNPDRLVVDLKNTTLSAKLPLLVKESEILHKIRKSSPPAKGTYRLVFELKSKASPTLFKLQPTPEKEYGHRLVVELSSASVEANNTSTSTSIPAPATVTSASSVSKEASQLAGNADIIVTIDAGHGGEDPGSVGPSRKYEKYATLNIAKKVAQQLNRTPGMKAVLTREGDYFLSLNKRTEIARSSKSHLLVSIHADSFRSSQPRGGSVFVLNTRRANTEISRWIEKHEEQSELLGGAGEVLAKNNNDKNVSQTLLDLQFSHSQKEGYKVATQILQEMGSIIRLHKKEPVYASLAVLKSPDIPSVLVETGFISNPIEEKLLFQGHYQDKLAKALSKAIVRYFEANPPEGTFLARSKTAKQHKVVEGDSLSVIAQQYGSSTKAIMSANNLKSTNVRIGQVLTIPADASSVSATKPDGMTNQNNQSRTQVITHTVKSGEYLGQIADKYKVTVAAIQKQNNLKRNTLLVGQKLKITVQQKNLPLRNHKVKSGEFLGKIAKQYNVTIDSLREINKLTTDTLAVGQVLIIPHK